MSALVSVTVCTADRAIHRFPTLEAAGDFVARRESIGRGLACGRAQATGGQLAGASSLAVLTVICQAPTGASRHEIAEIVRLSNDGIGWHVRRLESAGLIEQRSRGAYGLKRYVATAAGLAQAASGTGASPQYAGKGGRMAQVTDWLTAHPGATATEIADALGLAENTTRNVLARLQDMRAVFVQPGGHRSRRYQVTPEPCK